MDNEVPPGWDKFADSVRQIAADGLIPGHIVHTLLRHGQELAMAAWMRGADQIEAAAIELVGRHRAASTPATQAADAAKESS